MHSAITEITPGRRYMTIMNSATRIRPMMPALSEVLSASMPSVADTALEESRVMSRGSAPDMMRLASVCASSIVEEPEIMPEPSVMADCTVGVEMFSPSSWMEMVLPMFSVVALAKDSVASSFILNMTTGLLFSS